MDRPVEIGLGTAHLEREPIMRKQPPSAQGAVLLLALLLTALVTALIATALWRQAGQIQIETAERQRQQGLWLLNGASDWARLILREDARTSTSDHLSEPWAVPLQESRLSTFLSAQPGLADASIDTSLAEQVWLSGAITDVQGKFNLSNLFQDKSPDPVALAQLLHLFELLGLGSEQGLSMVERLSRARGDTARLFWPRTIDDLAAWGWPPETIERLRPHLTVLPDRSTLNVNTASAEVLAACVDGLGLAQAERLTQSRLRSPWTSVAMAQKVFGGWDAQRHGIQSAYFEVTGQLRMGSITLSQTALVKRDSNQVNYLWVSAQSASPRP